MFAELGVQADSDQLDGFSDKLGAARDIALGAAAAVGAVSAAAVGLTRQVAGTGREIQNTADRMGVGVEAVQELRWVAKRTGTDINSLQGSVNELAIRMDDVAREGAGPAAGAFQELGVQITDSEDRLLDTQTVFQDVVGELGDMENAAERAAMADRIFGGEAEKLLPILEMGADGLQEMTQQAHDLGIVMSEEEVAAAEQADMSFQMLFATLKGLRNEIALELMPTITESISAFRDWWAENQRLITQSVDLFVGSVASVFAVLTSTLMTLASMTGDITEFFGGLKNTLQTLIILVGSLAFAWALLNAEIIFSAFTAMVAWMKSAAAAAASWIAAMAPVLALGAAIAFIVLLVEDFFGFLEGDASLIGQIFGEGRDSILKAAAAVGAIITAVILLIGLIVGWPVALAVALAVLVGLIIAQWDTISQATMDFLSFLWDGIVSTFNSIKDWLAQLGQSIWDPVEDGWNTLMDTIESAFNAIMQGIEDRIESVTGAFSDVVDGAKSAVNTLPGVQISSPNREDGLMSHVLGQPEDMPRYDPASMIGGGAVNPGVDLQRRRRSAPSPSAPHLEMHNTFNVRGDRRDVAREIREELERMLRQANRDLQGGPQ